MNNYMDTAGNYSGIGTNKLLGKSFIWMFIGMIISGGAAWFTYSSGLWMRVFTSGMFTGLLLTELAAVVIFSFLFALSFLTLALYLLLEGTLGARKGRQEAKELASDEEKALSARFDAEQRMASLADLERRAYRLADRFSYRRLVYAALVLLLALIPPLLEGPFNLNYYLFTAFGLFGVGLASRGCVDYCALAPSRKADLDFYDQRLDPTPVS